MGDEESGQVKEEYEWLYKQTHEINSLHKIPYAFDLTYDRRLARETQGRREA